MKEGFVAEILRAVGTLRSGDPAGATDIIRAALAAGGLATPKDAASDEVRGAQTTSEPPSGTEAGRAANDHQAPPHPDGAGIRPGQPAEPRRHRLRKSLGETVRILSDARKAPRPDWKLPGHGAPAAVPVPEGAAFRDLQYSCSAGARRYRLYVPASAGDGLRGLIVMLHGCTQSPEDFAAGTGMNGVAEENRLLLVYPAQTRRDNQMACWNWFRPEDQTRGVGEPAIIAGLTESIRSEFGISRGRVFVAGLSAGGAMAAIMGETYPDLYAAVGVHSGLAAGSATDVGSAFSAMQGHGPAAEERVGSRGNDENGDAPRVIVFHGSADSTVHPANARRIVARQAGDPSRLVRSDHAPAAGVRGYTRLLLPGDDGTPVLECWMIDGAEHAWSGGHPSGSYTDPRGPNASAEMVRFFLAGQGGQA
jgi:poly(hydroxyalkanoate) depolymerase family esterase